MTSTNGSDTLIERLDKARAIAAKDRNRYDVTFHPGQLVLVHRQPPNSSNRDPTRRTRKLKSRASGPWRIIRQLANNNYQLQHTRLGEMDTFNVDSIVALRTTVEEATDDLDLASSMPESDDEVDFTSPYDLRSDDDETYHSATDDGNIQSHQTTNGETARNRLQLPPTRGDITRPMREAAAPGSAPLGPSYR